MTNDSWDTKIKKMTHGMSCDNGDMCDTCVKCDNTCVTVNII
jgi:hypothetical protein